MDSDGLGWTRLNSLKTRLDSAELGWTQLDSSGLRWTRMDSDGISVFIFLDSVELFCPNSI